MRSPDITCGYRKEKVYAKFVFDIISDMQPAFWEPTQPRRLLSPYKGPAEGK